MNNVTPIPTQGVRARRRPLRSAAAALAGATLLVSLLAAPTGAVAAPSELGPSVVKTNTGPTGYEVTFRYDAPDSVQSVQIFGEWLFSQPRNVLSTTVSDLRFGAAWSAGDILAGYNNGWLTQQMTKGDDGVWTFTTPLPGGTFSYTFVHDCASASASGCTRFPDPVNMPWANSISGANGQTLSQIYVPQHPQYATYDNGYQAPGAIGQLLDLSYTSPTPTDANRQRRVAVYLPRDYDSDRVTPYPTLYISHGAGGNESDWTTQGIAQYILENAVAEKAAQSFIVVATDFNGLQPAGAAGGGNGIPSSLVYATDVQQNVIPFVESNFNVSTSPADRAMAGLSAGANRTLATMYDLTGNFEYYGAWSPPAGLSYPSGYSAPDAPQLERLLAVRGGIQLGVGLQDWLGGANPIRTNSVLRAQALQDAGVEVNRYEIDGIHSWDVWRQELDYFIRTTLFRTTEVSVAVTGPVVANKMSKAVATVDAVTSNGIVPGAKVQFYLGEDAATGVNLGAAQVGKDGTASLPFKIQTVGAAKIVAVYEGDEYYNSSTSSTDLEVGTK